MIIMIIFLFIIVVVVQKTVDNGCREKLQELREVKDGLEEIIDHLHNKAVPAVCLGFWDWRQFFPLIFPSVFLGSGSTGLTPRVRGVFARGQGRYSLFALLRSQARSALARPSNFPTTRGAAKGAIAGPLGRNRACRRPGRCGSVRYDRCLWVMARHRGRRRPGSRRIWMP